MPELRRGLSDVNLGLLDSEYVNFNLPVCQTAGDFIPTHGLSVSQLAKRWINPLTLGFPTGTAHFPLVSSGGSDQGRRRTPIITSTGGKNGSF